MTRWPKSVGKLSVSVRGTRTAVNQSLLGFLGGVPLRGEGNTAALEQCGGGQDSNGAVVNRSSGGRESLGRLSASTARR
jgi:hypothetical protein